MDYREFIKKEAPRRCEVHPSYGLIAEAVFDMEIKDNAFPAEDFNSVRERAKMLLPYHPNNREGYESALDIIEYMISRHRVTEHGEPQHNDRVMALSKTVLPDMEAIGLDATKAWWYPT